MILKVLTCLMCLTAAHASAQELLIDRSSSLKSPDLVQQANALRSLGNTFVSVTPWGGEADQQLWGRAQTLAAALPVRLGSTNLRPALAQFNAQTTACRHFMIVVHGIVDDRSDAQRLMQQLVLMNHIDIFVMPTTPGQTENQLEVYEKLIEHANYQVHRLTPEALVQVYELRQSAPLEVCLQVGG